MPRGYYLGQGLIPLGYSSSDDEEGPCELPNGRLVCGPHGLVVCGRCCTDYSFMDDVLNDDENDDSEVEEDEDEEPDELPEHGIQMVKGTGKVFPSIFIPSNSNTAPLEEFSNRYQHMNIFRQVVSLNLPLL